MSSQFSENDIPAGFVLVTQRTCPNCGYTHVEYDRSYLMDSDPNSEINRMTRDNKKPFLYFPYYREMECPICGYRGRRAWFYKEIIDDLKA